MEKYIKPDLKCLVLDVADGMLDISGQITDDPATEPAWSKEAEAFEDAEETSRRSVWDE